MIRSLDKIASSLNLSLKIWANSNEFEDDVDKSNFCNLMS